MSDLLTEELRALLPPVGSQGECEPREVMIYAKFIEPDAGWSWYVMEGEPVGDPEEGSDDYMFFGFVRGVAEEYGSFTLRELQLFPRNMGGSGSPVQRDEAFTPTRLPEVAAADGLDVYLGEAR